MPLQLLHYCFVHIYNTKQVDKAAKVVILLSHTVIGGAINGRTQERQHRFD